MRPLTICHVGQTLLNKIVVIEDFVVEAPQLSTPWHEAVRLGLWLKSNPCVNEMLSYFPVKPLFPPLFSPIDLNPYTSMFFTIFLLYFWYKLLDLLVEYVQRTPKRQEKMTLKRVVDFVKDKGDEGLNERYRKSQRMLEETLTKNIALQNVSVNIQYICCLSFISVSPVLMGC